MNAKQFIHLHRVGRGHPAEVVADEVDDHDIFRLLLFARRQGRFQGVVFFFGGTSFHGALDGLRMQETSSFGQKPFRTRAHGPPLARLDVRGMGGPGLFGKPLKNGPTRGTRGFPSPWHAEVHFVDVSAPQSAMNFREFGLVHVFRPKWFERFPPRVRCRAALFLVVAFRQQGLKLCRPWAIRARDDFRIHLSWPPFGHHFGFPPTQQRPLAGMWGCRGLLRVQLSQPEAAVQVVPEPSKCPTVLSVGRFHKGIPSLPISRAWRIDDK